MSQQLPESPEKTKQQASRRETQPIPVHSFQAGPHPILQLQRILGNRRVAQLIQARRLTPEGGIIGLQPKLTVGAADDQYEQEADHVARQVVSMPDSAVPASSPQTSSVDGDPSQARTLQSKPLPLAASITSFVQRQIGAEEESEKDQDREEAKDELLQAKFFNKSAALPLQRQTATEEEKTDSIQAKSAGSLSDSFEAGDDVESRLNQSKGGGTPLPDPVRAYMEPRFGVDFSHVRIHTGSEAIQMNRDVGAQAFTHGSDIYYGAGSSPVNLELTAHELTHVMQQTGVSHRRPTDSAMTNRHQSHPQRLSDANHLSVQTPKQQVSEQATTSDTAVQSNFGAPPEAQRSNYILALQQVIGNQAVQRLLVSPATGPIIQLQRDAETDLLDALVLTDYARAVTLLEQLNDAELNARISEQSPEQLLGLRRAAQRAHLSRVTQAIQNVQIRTGTQVDTFEGSTIRTPVTLFQSGVMINKDVHFVKRGHFRSDGDFEMLRDRIMEAVRTRLTNRFKLKIETAQGTAQQGDGEYPIRVQFINNPSGSYEMRLFGQRHGRSSVGETSGDIFELGMPGDAEESDTVLAHESAHVLLGARDEFADAAHPTRPVFTDHSLMGNFPTEGEAQAELKARHFGALVRLVSRWFPGRNVSIIQ